MEMVSGNAKRCGERRRPYSHQGSTQLLESKFLLNGRSCSKPRSFRNRLHNPGLDSVEASVHAKGIENVIRVAELVTDLNQVIKAGYPLMFLSKAAAKPRHHGIRYEALTLDGGDGARCCYLIADTIEHYHLPVEVSERPQPEISML